MVDPDRTDPAAYYDDYGEREWERLERSFFHRLEWEGTIEQLGAHLPAIDDVEASRPVEDDDSSRAIEGDDSRRPIEDDDSSQAIENPSARPRVLDVGGGAGRYSIWLADRGYDVTLVDLSETQRELAREKIAEHDAEDRVSVEPGDVRDLPHSDDRFDATCCLGGPLSHVLDETKRRAAARELRRVTVPGGPVFVSVMGLLGATMITVQYAGRVEEELDDLVLLPDLVREGDYTPELAERHDIEPAIFDCHFFRRDELAALLSEAGLIVESVVALEGVAATRRSHFEDLGAEDRDAIRELNDLLRTDPTVADVSPHMLAVCRV